MGGGDKGEGRGRRGVRRGEWGWGRRRFEKGKLLDIVGVRGLQSQLSHTIRDGGAFCNAIFRR